MAPLQEHDIRSESVTSVFGDAEAGLPTLAFMGDRGAMHGTLLVLLLAAATTGSVPRFDLVRSGTGNTIEDSAHVVRQEVRYRIDLISRQWCAEQCVSINHIVRSDRNAIVLQDQSERDLFTRQEVNRLSGRETFDQYVGKTHIFSNLECTAVPFSGFTQPRF